MPDLSIIPAAALQDEELTGTDIRVLCAIGKHTDRNGVGCWAHAATLADEARVSRNQFFISTRKLLERGWIERESGQLQGDSSKYAVLFPTLRARGGVSKNGTPPEYPKTVRESPKKQDATTISAPLSVTSAPWNQFSESELETISNVLIRVPQSGVISWTSEVRAMLAGMGGHVHATPAAIAKGFQDLAGNGKAESPNLRQFRRYVADAMEAEKEDNNETALMYARELWEVIRRYGLLTVPSREMALELFTNAANDKILLAFTPERALEIFLSLQPGALQSASSKEFPIRHIADRIAKQSRGPQSQQTGGENGRAKENRARA